MATVVIQPSRQKISCDGEKSLMQNLLEAGVFVENPTRTQP